MAQKEIFRPVCEDEVQAVFDLIQARVRWMDQVGIRQWNVTDYAAVYPLSHYEALRQKGELFALWSEEGELLCAGALLLQDERWEGQETAKAVYLHHLASKLGAEGAGSRFLQAAEAYAAACGKERFRLDSADDNEVLARYYQNRGYGEAGR